KRIRGGFETGLIVGECGVRRLVIEPASARLEFCRRREAAPYRRSGSQDMRQRNESCSREDTVPNVPKTGGLGLLGMGDRWQGSGTGKSDTCEFEKTTSIHCGLPKEEGGGKPDRVAPVAPVNSVLPQGSCDRDR